MHYSRIKFHDIANGPGVRVSLYVSGCSHHCPGCFNPETWDFSAGDPFDETVEQQILDGLAPSYIKGFSLLGGEPFEPENSPSLAPFLRKLRQQYPGKTIWCYTGYQFDRDLLAGKTGDPEVVASMLSCLDVLVDGAFQEEKKVIDLRFRGSTNQRLIDVPASLSQGKTVLWEDPDDRRFHEIWKDGTKT